MRLVLVDYRDEKLLVKVFVELQAVTSNHYFV